MANSTYAEVKGDLIELAKEGAFDVIAHGANCFCVMGSGIAPQMAKLSGCNQYAQEAPFRRGDMNKLGNIDIGSIYVGLGRIISFTTHKLDKGLIGEGLKHVEVVNCYTQYDITRHLDVDYAATAMCFKKLNYVFKGKHIGLPQIGCGLAGGDWNVISKQIQSFMKQCKVTVVIYEPKKQPQNI